MAFPALVAVTAVVASLDARSLHVLRRCVSAYREEREYKQTHLVLKKKTIVSK